MGEASLVLLTKKFALDSRQTSGTFRIWNLCFRDLLETRSIPDSRMVGVTPTMGRNGGKSVFY